MNNSDLARLIGGRVRGRRADLGMTQTDLGHLTGIAVPHISRLEAGTHMPTVGTLRNVALALGCTIGELTAEPQKVKTSR